MSGTVIFLTVTFVPHRLDVSHSQLIRNVEEPANTGLLTAVAAFASMLKWFGPHCNIHIDCSACCFVVEATQRLTVWKKWALGLFILPTIMLIKGLSCWRMELSTYLLHGKQKKTHYRILSWLSFTNRILFCVLNLVTKLNKSNTRKHNIFFKIFTLCMFHLTCWQCCAVTHY